MTDETMEFRTDKKKALEGLKKKEGMGIEKSEWDITCKQEKKRKTERQKRGEGARNNPDPRCLQTRCFAKHVFPTLTST